MSRKQINLFQAAFRPPVVILPAQSLLAGVLVFSLGLLALYGWDVWRGANLRAETDHVVARADAVARQVGAAEPGLARADPRIIAEATALEARVRALQSAQQAVAGGALGSETGFAGQFRALARITVSGAWLTRVEIADRGHEMNLHGRALNGESPARLIAGLGREPLFVGLSYAALNVHPPEPQAGGGAAEQAPPVGESKHGVPRFLEFSLIARLPEAVARAQLPAATAAVAGMTP